MRTIAYARVSTEDQANNGVSLDLQLRASIGRASRACLISSKAGRSTPWSCTSWTA
jgi:hypothetical protein